MPLIGIRNAILGTKFTWLGRKRFLEMYTSNRSWCKRSRSSQHVPIIIVMQKWPKSIISLWISVVSRSKISIKIRSGSLRMPLSKNKWDLNYHN